MTQINPSYGNAITSGSPDSVFSQTDGSVGEFELNAWAKLFLHFDISILPFGVDIITAVFHLYQYYGSSDPGTVDCRRCTTTINNATTTWNNQPTTTDTDKGSVYISAQGWHEINILNILRTARDSGNTFGIKLSCDTDNVSKMLEQGHLDVTYTAPSADIYIDASKANDTGNGLSFANAKKYLSSGYAILSSAGTIHAASGTYSKSGITFNKSWKLSPEDPNSVGYKNAKIGA